MENVYKSTLQDYDEQALQLEKDLQHYSDEYEKIKLNRAMRFIKGSVHLIFSLAFKTIAFTCLIIFFRLAVTSDSESVPWQLRPVFIITSALFFLMAWLMDILRKKNKAIHNLSDLLETILAKKKSDLEKK